MSSDYENIDTAYNTMETSPGHSEEPENHWSNAQYRITNQPVRRQAEKLSKRERNRYYRPTSRPFGSRRKTWKGKKRGRPRTNEFKALVMCKLCGRNLPNVPDCTLTKNIVDQFLTDYAGICPCKPPHCDMCTCGQCDSYSMDSQIQAGKIEPEKGNSTTHITIMIIFFPFRLPNDR